MTTGSSPARSGRCILTATSSAESSVQQWLQIMGPVGEEGLDLRQNARVRVARQRSKVRTRS
jgi:hypothetical protein